MINFRQRSLLMALFENTPSIFFLGLLHWVGDLRLAGWSGAIFAAAVCTAYITRTIKPHAILLGINIYMLLITPSIEMLVFLDMNAWADMLIANAQSFVLVAIFLTGCVMTAFTKNGFLGAPNKHRKQVIRYSLLLLGVSFLSIVLTFAVNAGRFSEIGIPLLLLFGIRQFLIARMEDREDK